MATKKNKAFADLIVPFMGCPFDKVESDCPFIPYWENTDFDEMLVVIDKMPENKLESLRKHHKICLNKKIDKGEKLVNL
jgi:hypothetical protein